MTTNMASPAHTNDTTDSTTDSTSAQPTSQPTAQPTDQPTSQPVESPTGQPTDSKNDSSMTTGDSTDANSTDDTSDAAIHSKLDAIAARYDQLNDPNDWDQHYERMGLMMTAHWYHSVLIDRMNHRDNRKPH